MSLVLALEVRGLEAVITRVEGIVCITRTYQHGVRIVLEHSVDGACLGAVADQTVICDEIPVFVV